MKHLPIVLLLAALASGSWPRPAPAVDASPPQGVTLTVSDAGFALASELRRVNLAKGESEVRFGALPVEADPSSFHVMVAPDARGLELIEHRFLYDLADLPSMAARFAGEPVSVRGRGETLAGRLTAGGPRDGWLTLLLPEGGGLAAVPVAGIDSLKFLGGMPEAFLEPTLLWRCSAAIEGPQNVRLTYVVRAIDWSAGYEVVVEPDGRSARLESRVVLRNRSGGSYDAARVRLTVTERGSLAGSSPSEGAAGGALPSAMRYRYGSPDPRNEISAASLAPVMTLEMPRPVSLRAGETINAEYVAIPAMAVSRFYVYDGVRFDRFQRNRRNDWSYGTECQGAVEAHLEFTHAGSPGGTGKDLPPGAFRLYQRAADGSLDFMGEDMLHAVPVGQSGHIVVGPVKGLSGARERTGYSEVKPLHEYEESFEIRLANDSADEIEIRVVEHLYRWQEYEIVKSDTEYTALGPQAIEFRPVVKPGGKRSIHYTVRYRW
jgi:hypothetical protein